MAGARRSHEQSGKRCIVIAVNSGWNLLHFRRPLVRWLQSEGYEVVALIPAGDPDAAAIERTGVACMTVNLDRSGLNPLVDGWLLFQYRRFLRQLAPTALLTFTIKPNVYGCIAARAARVPAVVNITGLGTAFLRGSLISWLAEQLYRHALQRARRVFFQNSEDLKRFVGRRIVRDGQARLIPGDGIDLQRYSPSPAPGGAPTFLLVGRVLRDKGVLEFVEAARAVRSRFPKARFQLLGPLDTGNRSAIAAGEVAEWHAQGVVEYLGEAADVRPAIAAASAVVLPSYREGLPRTLLEAAAMARPMIASDVPGCRDVIEHGVNGLLCQVRSASSLAHAMETFLRMPKAARVAMGAAARLTAQERFGEDRVVEAYRDALEAVTGQDARCVS